MVVDAGLELTPCTSLKLTRNNGLLSQDWRPSAKSSRVGHQRDHCLGRGINEAAIAAHRLRCLAARL